MKNSAMQNLVTWVLLITISTTLQAALALSFFCLFH